MKKNYLKIIQSFQNFLLICVFFFSVCQTFGQTTYTWTGASGGSWTIAGNWSPSRTTPATNDILQFTSGTVTVTNVQSQTIGQLLVTGGAAVSLNRSTSNITLVIGGGTGTDLVVDASSQLNVAQTTSNSLVISVATGATGSISGSITYSSTVASTTMQLLAADASSVTFNSGAVFTQSTNATGSAFGTSGTAGTIVFAPGANFVSASGANPFGLGAPNSKVNFQTGSNYKHNQSSAPAFSNRTYPNFEWNAAGPISVTGATAVTMDNLTITSGIFNINLTGGANIKGNVSVASGATLTFTPASFANINFNGSSSSQTITNAGTLTFGANANVVIANTFTTPSVTFNSALTIPATTTVNAGSILNNNSTLIISTSLVGNGNINNISTGTITVPTATINTGSTLTNNGIMNISTNLQSGGSFVNDITGTLNYGGASASITTLTASAVGNTVNYNAAGAQTIKDIAYSNLTVSGGNTKTWANFNNRTFKNLTIATSTTLTITGSTPAKTYTVTDIFTNDGTLTIIPNLTDNATLLLTTGGTKTNSGTITVPTLSVGAAITLTNNGTIDANTSLTGTGTFINSATSTLNYGGTAAPAITTLTTSASGNTVNYNGAAQSMSAGTYSNLIISGSGVKTPAASTTVNNLFTINAGTLGTNSITYGAAASLKYDTASTFTQGLEWNAGASTSPTAGLGVPAAVTLQSGTLNFGTTAGTPGTVTIANTATLNVNENLFGNSFSNDGAIAVAVNKTVNINNAFVNNKTAADVVFNNGSSLVQNNSVSNTGNITYKRTTSTLVNDSDFVYWGSPVENQTLAGFWMTTTNDTFYSFDNTATPQDWAYAAPSTTMDVGKGYISRALAGSGSPIWNPGDSWTANFVGKPNNGNVPFTMVNGGGTNIDNLMANPYPSAFDLVAFRTDTDNSAKLTGNFYFWTHNTPLTGNNYTSSDYAIFNVAIGGGTTTSGATPAPDRHVDACQGFFAEAATAGTVLFKNTHRVSGNNNAFYKNAVAGITINKLWLNLTNSNGVFKQQLLAYADGATNNFDATFDAKTMDSHPVVDFYSVIPTNKLTIQSRSAFTAADMVQLGFKTNLAGNYKISIDHKDGIFAAGQTVYLQDNLLGIDFDITNSDYNFTTTAGTFDTRFVLKYTSTLSTNNSDYLNNSVIVSTDKKVLKIKSITENIKSIAIFDVLGREVFEKDDINNQNYNAENIVSSQQTLIVKIRLANHEVVTRKIVVF